jgi:hypothetical protein
MNPFTLNYNSKYFCDRESELKQFTENVINGRNTLLHSPRRLGKSAVIHHFFHHLEKQGKAETLFIDLFATQNMEDLIKLFAEKILEKYHSKNFLTGITKLLKGISTTLSFSQDGTPSLSLNIQENQHESTLHGLFAYLEKRKKKVVVAFDEFQEIASYPEKAEAILRTHIQQLNNLIFIFSGSSNHLLKEMFYSAKRPFYQSCEVIVLDKIKRIKYAGFIKSLFEKGEKKIEKEAIDHLLDFSDVYTYYTQAICNQAYYQTNDKLTEKMAIEISKTYIQNRKADYQSLFSLLPKNHKKVVIAVARKEIVSEPTSIKFIMHNDLPSVSSTLQAVKALAEKEILYKTNEGYIIYDVFFKRFIRMYYQ